MNKFSERTVILMLISILVLSVLVRYPLGGHERHQSDSFYIHYLSQTIVEEEYSPWTLNALSYLGYYSFSYPSGVPFLIAEFSIMTQLNIEFCVLFFGIILGVTFALAMFCFAREFLSRVDFTLIAVLFGTLSPRFVDTTYWVGSSRGLLVVLMVLTLFSLMRAQSMHARKLYVPALAIGACCFAVHHMAVLFVLFGLAYVLTIFMLNYVGVSHSATRIRKGHFLLIILIAFVVIAFLAVDFFQESLETGFSVETNIFTFDPWYVSAMMNLAVSYTHQFGLILVFSVVYMASFFRKGDFKWKSALLIAVTFAFIPLVGNALYISLIILPVVAVLGTLWFHQCFENRARTKCNVILCVVVAMSLFLPTLSTLHWNNQEYRSGDSVQIDDSIVTDSTYLTHAFGESYALYNNEVAATQISVYSDLRIIRLGIPSLVNGDVEIADIKENTTISDSSFPSNLYIWFKYSKELNVYSAVRGLMVEGTPFLFGGSYISDYSQSLFSEHKNLVVLVDNDWPDSYVGIWIIEESRFQRELESSAWQTDYGAMLVGGSLHSYLVYSTERTSAYVVGLPL